MSAESDLREECVRLLRELLPELSGHRLSPRGENICFAASNRLARLDAFEPKDTERPAPPEPASFVFRDADWPPPANGAPCHPAKGWSPLEQLDEPMPEGATPADALATRLRAGRERFEAAMEKVTESTDLDDLELWQREGAEHGWWP